MTDVHWHDKTVKHSGIESTLRYAMKKVYIIEGREVAKKVNASCKLCHYLKKQRIKVSMGKLPKSCMTIAPAFYNLQIDLAGPFQEYTNHNKRPGKSTDERMSTYQNQLQRLKLGRNNDRSPSGLLTVTRNFSKILECNKLILNAWFDCWLINHVPKIIQQLKWFHQDQDTMVGDSLQRTTPPFR